MRRLVNGFVSTSYTPLLPTVPADSLCEDGDVRLDTSDAIVGGRLDVCYDGIWGSVCNEMWTDIDAQVACNQLGLPSTGGNVFLNNNSL